jgi:hypothetical protein
MFNTWRYGRALSCIFLMADALVRSQSSPRGICGGYTDCGAGLFPRISVLFSPLSSHWNIKRHHSNPRTSAHTTDVKRVLSRQQLYLTQGKEPDKQVTYKALCTYELTP